jgi:predicted nucleic-acid-binding Zn-ribbon protein
MVHIDRLTTQVPGYPPGEWIKITGHNPTTGHPVTIDHSARLYVIEDATAGSLVTYHGSHAEARGSYRVASACTCKDCDTRNTRERRFVLTGQGYKLHHVRRASFTITQPACTQCGYAARLFESK